MRGQAKEQRKDEHLRLPGNRAEGMPDAREAPAKSDGTPAEKRAPQQEKQGQQNQQQKRQSFEHAPGVSLQRERQ